MSDPFITGLFATLIVASLTSLVALIARRLEKHLDKQDQRLGRIERQIYGIMVKLGMGIPADQPGDE